MRTSLLILQRIVFSTARQFSTSNFKISQFSNKTSCTTVQDLCFQNLTFHHESLKKKSVKDFIQQRFPRIYMLKVMLIQWLNHPHTSCQSHVKRCQKYYNPPPPHTHSKGMSFPLRKTLRSALWYHYFVSVMPEALKMSPWAVTRNDTEEYSCGITVHLVL